MYPVGIWALVPSDCFGPWDVMHNRASGWETELLVFGQGDKSHDFRQQVYMRYYIAKETSGRHKTRSVSHSGLSNAPDSRKSSIYPCRFSFDKESPCIDPRTSRHKIRNGKVEYEDDYLVEHLDLHVSLVSLVVPV